MKKLLIVLAVLVAMLMVTEVASAGGRHGHNGGGYRYHYRSYGFSGGVRPSFLSSGWDYYPCGRVRLPPPVIYRPQPIYYSQPAVVYTQPAVMIREARVPAVITTWDDGSLLNLGSQKFAELSGTSDVDAKNLRIAILEKDYQTTKGVRVIEEVKFLAKWVVVIKDKDGHEREQEHSKKFKLKFDDYGNWEKFDD